MGASVTLALAGHAGAFKQICHAECEWPETSLRQTLWEGPLKLPSQTQMELHNNLAAFVILSDRDRDGMLSVNEFIEYAATVISVSKRDVHAWHVEVPGCLLAKGRQ